MATLGADQLGRFFEDGYLVVEGVVGAARLAAVLDDCAEIAVGLVAAAIERGEVEAAVAALPWQRQLVELARATGRDHSQHFDISLPVRGHVDRDTPMNTRRSVFDVLVDPGLLDAVACLVGPEVTCNPVQHLRIKLPQAAMPRDAGFLAAMVPWHQDSGVVLAEADDTCLVTAWVAVTDATVRNGCLQVVPGSQRAPVLRHCLQVNQYEIPAELVCELGEPVALEVPAGSVVFLDRRTVHASLHNTSESDVRVSLDLRYQPTGQATGRPLFPAFVARSAAAPASALADPAAWARLWDEVRGQLPDELVPEQFFRWGPTGNLCA
ncbi:MAG TPA: phytanoyl-CoA dioxygenase family protein [Acidimicrobiales bacterium]|nr:phytanoyl-CoA dioxygenase family protein [Acidimicrobiales bacterium]